MLNIEGGLSRRPTGVGGVTTIDMASDAAASCERPAVGSAITDESAVRLASAFSALADPARVKIIDRLLDVGAASVCVCDFVDLLGLSQPAVSYHLKVLREAGLVERERRGSFAHYRLRPDALYEPFTSLRARAVTA
jgi:ArsR family transcriptional regulator, arsenate/arsenite/antimonite-responsive transcriptional repressor